MQEEVERALATILRGEVALTVAGRTDRGVHAWGQVASYEGEPADARRRSTRSCPPTSPCWRARRRPTASTRAATRARAPTATGMLTRRARSPFERGRALWWPRPLDVDALQACAAALPGTHDFTAFTPTQTEHVRFERDVLDARWERAGDLLEFWITADTFMRHMNRALVGTMLEVATAAALRGVLRARCSPGARAPRPATPPRRTGSTWRRWPTDCQGSDAPPQPRRASLVWERMPRRLLTRARRSGRVPRPHPAAAQARTAVRVGIGDQ